MTPASIAADRLSEQSSAFAVALWEALSKIPLMDRRDTFESAVQLIAQGVAGREAANLVEAFSMLTALDQFPNRKTVICNEADDAYSDYVRLLQDEQGQEAADHYADLARDERLLGAA